LIGCTTCFRQISYLRLIVINAVDLAAGLWQLRCDCSHRFSVSEFLQAGAVFRSGKDALRAMRARN